MGLFAYLLSIHFPELLTRCGGAALLIFPGWLIDEDALAILVSRPCSALIGYVDCLILLLGCCCENSLLLQVRELLRCAVVEMDVNVLLLRADVVYLWLLLLCRWYFLVGFYLLVDLLDHVALDELLLLRVGFSVHIVLIVDAIDEAALLAGACIPVCLFYFLELTWWMEKLERSIGLVAHLARQRGVEVSVGVVVGDHRALEICLFVRLRERCLRLLVDIMHHLVDSGALSLAVICNSFLILLPLLPRT